jgi:lipoprotein-releasing system ATP-binding protein
MNEIIGDTLPMPNVAFLRRVTSASRSDSGEVTTFGIGARTVPEVGSMIEAINLHKSYNQDAQELHVLKGIELKIEKGKFVAVLGPSGAGKTTLVHLLGGLDYPSQGSVFFDGQDIYALSDNRLAELRNKRLGFIFQFYHLLSEFNALENVLLPGLIIGNHSRLRQNAQILLEQVGLKERMRYFPAQLSGGEQQRLAIARALINQPDLLFCDEPTGNLDTTTGKQIIDLLREINRSRKMSLILVTHNLELSQAADQVYHLRDGLLVS